MNIPFEIINTIIGANPMPPPDPLGYPLPPWIIQSLSYLTLTLHLLAMNFTIGGAFYILWSYFRKPEGYTETVRFFGAAMPLGLSYVITLGIPPLLFVQVLYGQLFYSSSIILGSFWIQVIPLVMLAYALFYYHKFNSGTQPRFQWLAIAVALAAMLFVGFIYVNNLTLTMSPEKWQALYAAHPGGGILSHGERSVHPRYTLFLAGAFAVAGTAMIWRGTYLIKWGFDKEGRRSQSSGLKAFFISPLIWIVSAGGIFATRGADISATFSQISATLPLLAIGLASLTVAAVFAFLARGKAKVIYPLMISIGLVGAMTSMVIFRDLVRIAYLKPYFYLDSVPVNHQWGMFAMFTAALVAGLLLLIVLFIKVFPGMAEAARERLKNSVST